MPRQSEQPLQFPTDARREPTLLYVVLSSALLGLFVAVLVIAVLL